jgi:hypothetical protein
MDTCLLILLTSLWVWTGSLTMASMVACWSSENMVGTGPAVLIPSYMLAFISHVCSCRLGRLSLNIYIGLVNVVTWFVKLEFKRNC